MEEKKWYQSKIVAASLLAIAAALYHLIGGAAEPVLTPEQIAAINQVAPALVDEIKEVKQGQTTQELLQAFIGFAIILFRVFGTRTVIARAAI